MGKGKQNKFKERNAASHKREVKSIEIKQGRKEPLIVLSFKDFDRNQGQNFEEWEHEQLLALAVNKLREVCQLIETHSRLCQLVCWHSARWQKRAWAVYAMHIIIY